MASSEAKERQPAAELALDPGELVLVESPSLRRLLRRLPDEAFRNLLVLTVRQPKRVEHIVREAGHDPTRVGVIPISASDIAYDGPCWTADRVSPSDLTGISIQFSKGYQHLIEGQGWVVFDGLGTMLMYANERKLFHLLSYIAAQTRARDLRGVAGVAPAVASKETMARFQTIYDRAVGLE